MSVAAMRHVSGGSRAPPADPANACNHSEAQVAEPACDDDDDTRGRPRTVNWLPNMSMKWRIAALLFVLAHAVVLFLVSVAETPRFTKPEEDDDTPKMYAWGVTVKGVWEQRPLPFLSRNRDSLTEAPDDHSLELFAEGVTKSGRKIKRPLPRHHRITQ